MASLLSKVVPYEPPFACPLRLLRLSSSRRTRARAEATARTGSVMSSAPALLAALVVLSSSSVPSSPDTLYDVPQTLSGDDKKQARIQRPKSRKAEKCVGKCVTTCILGGAGSPGEGPFNIRRPLVVFKDGFRSRQYCLVRVLRHLQPNQGWRRWPLIQLFVLQEIPVLNPHKPKCINLNFVLTSLR